MQEGKRSGFLARLTNYKKIVIPQPLWLTQFSTPSERVRKNISKPFKIHQQPPNAPQTRTTTDKEARNLSEEAGFKVMLKKGLEPLCREAYEPESYVSTNFTT